MMLVESPHALASSIDLILCLHRLFEKELQYIVNHAKDEYIMLDLTFVDLMAKMQHKFPTVKGYIILTDRQHMPKNSKLQNMLCYEDVLQVRCSVQYFLKHHNYHYCSDYQSMEVSREIIDKYRTI